MKILVTGSAGFVGKNLVVALKRRPDVEVFKYDVDSPVGNLETYLVSADVIYHLAGVNRPERVEEFEEGNAALTRRICETLTRLGRKPVIIMSSSTQAELANPYGTSKRKAEEAVLAFGRASDADVYVYRLPGVFGKWCRPNYNSVVATFCHNIANDLPIQINDPDVVMNLVYIDDVVSSFEGALGGTVIRNGEFCQVEPVHTCKLGTIAELIRSFKESRESRSIPDMSDPFTKKLYSTYLSYLPVDGFSYPLQMNVDDRGSFTEFIKTVDRGQVSVNVSKPGITKGNHWHHTKNEKFLVVSGEGVIRFRKIGDDEIVEYRVSGDKLEVVDIPPGYTHTITNIGPNDLVTVMWCNEVYDPDRADTFVEPVTGNW